MRRRAGFIFIIVLFMLAAGTGLALAGDGSGDGSGGNQKNPLVIESSFPADGATNVADLEFIKVVFSKNIAYMTIRDNNIKCVSLWSEGENIPCEIIIADDQIAREKRNDIIIKPLQALQQGSNYRVEFAPELKSKSGVTLGSKKTISFTTAGSKGTLASESVGQTAASGSGDQEPVQTPDELTANTGDTADSDSETKPVTETGGVDESKTEEINDGQKQAENLEAVSPGDKDQKAVEVPEQADPIKRMEKAGLWIAIAALAGLAAGWGYRRLRK